MWCLAAELREGASSTKPFVCQGCAYQPARVPGAVPGCSEVEKTLPLSHLKHETADTIGGRKEGAKNNSRLKISTVKIALGMQAHRDARVHS